MTHKICDNCETVQHCSQHGCIPSANIARPHMPEPLRLAAWLTEGAWYKMRLGDVEAAGREMKRLYEENERLSAALNAAAARGAQVSQALSDAEIDAICQPGRAERWQGDGRQYDRDTARLAIACFASSYTPQCQHVDALQPVTADVIPAHFVPIGPKLEPITLRGKPAWDSHSWPQIVQDSAGNWFGVHENWTMSIVAGFKGDELSLLREDGEFLQFDDPSPNWRTSLERRPAGVRDVLDLRGQLAAALSVWHRLKGSEADELVALVRGLCSGLQRAASGVQLADTREGRIYVAGPMTGIPDFNFPAFNSAAAELRGQGLQVVNPAEHGIIEGAKWADYLHYDLGRLATCSAVYLLPGWSNSKGARLEVYVAQALGMRIELAEGAESLHPLAPALTMTGYQLEEALGFIAPDSTAEQLEQSVDLQHGPERTHDEGTDPAGLRCWLTEYPEEGAIHLNEQPAAGAAPPSAAELLRQALCRMNGRAPTPDESKWIDRLLALAQGQGLEGGA